MGRLLVRPPRARHAASVSALLVVLASPAHGQAPDEAAARARDLAAEYARRETVLQAVEARLQSSDDSRRTIATELDGLQGDGPRLTAALVDTAARARAAEQRIEAVATRLDEGAVTEAALRRSLDGRRALVAEVLAALQRMGGRAPPAVIVRPDDIVAAVRTSMLLGSLVPELRAETDVLAADLGRLVELRRDLSRDRERFVAEVEALGRERERLAALSEARRRRVSALQLDLGRERARVEALATEARTLRDLVDGLGRDAAAARRVADEARRRAEAEADAARERFAAASAREPARLAPRVAFQTVRGQLPFPAAGTVRAGFGMQDAEGNMSRGNAIVTPAGAVVTSPADGAVVFAGPFRSYGRLLIIDAGGGYTLVLAGLDMISVEVGQFVIAGEPVGRMGESAGERDVLKPVLLVELRKDGAAIDPAPWWAKSQGEKVRG